MKMKMKKKNAMLFSLTGVIVLALISTGLFFASPSIEVNGKDLTPYAAIEEDTLYLQAERVRRYAEDGADLDEFTKKINGVEHVKAREFFNHLGYSVSWDIARKKLSFTREGEDRLPVIGSQEKLDELLSDYRHEGTKELREGIIMEAPEDVSALDEAPALEDAETDVAAADGEEVDYSETNIQEEGVDEADIVKTDGRYLYQLTEDSEFIKSRIYPADKMEVEDELTFEKKDFNAKELYLQGNHAVVVGTYREEIEISERPEEEEEEISVTPEEEANPGEMERRIEPSPPIEPPVEPPMPPIQPQKTITRAYVLEISGEEVEVEREVDIEGSYNTSRLVDSCVHLITDFNLSPVSPVRQPHLRDSKGTGEFEPVDLDRVTYFPDHVRPRYVNILTFDLEQKDKEPGVESYLGSGDEVYMSRDNLYLTMRPDYNTTQIYKFNVEGTSVEFDAKGEVKGRLLNQFSMDEHEGFFRIATTCHEGEMTNNLFILNDRMETVSKITGIAPTERIYSARFMGEKAYMVTFEIIDPFFVMDLSDPFNPEILGELKIPGFSNYLHPIDEDHILGIGKDVTVKESAGGFPRVIEEGLKISVFDVTDVTDPVEEHVEILGSRGTESEALSNHKAVFFDSRNNLLSLPVSLREDREFKNQGAYVYHLDVEKGIKLIGEESHLSEPGRREREEFINRTLYIEDVLYFISDSHVTARDVDSFEPVGTLELR